jgi:hypothetical protein
MQGLPFILMPLCWALALSLRCSPLLARPGLLSLLGPKTRHHERCYFNTQDLLGIGGSHL